MTYFTVCRFYEGVRKPSTADIQMLDNAVFDTDAYKCTHGAQLTSGNSRDVLKYEPNVQISQHS